MGVNVGLMTGFNMKFKRVKTFRLHLIINMLEASLWVSEE